MAPAAAVAAAAASLEASLTILEQLGDAPEARLRAAKARLDALLTVKVQDVALVPATPLEAETTAESEALAC